MHGPVRNTVSSTSQDLFSMPEQLQCGRRRLAEKKIGGVTGEEGDFWRRGLGSKTKDCTHHTLQICAINFLEKREFFV